MKIFNIKNAFDAIKAAFVSSRVKHSCRKASENYLSVISKDGEYRHYKVPYEVYQYVQQLETYIKHPDISKLKEVYKERFGNAIFIKAKEKGNEKR